MSFFLVRSRHECPQHNEYVFITKHINVVLERVQKTKRTFLLRVILYKSKILFISKARPIDESFINMNETDYCNSYING